MVATVESTPKKYTPGREREGKMENKREIKYQSEIYKVVVTVVCMCEREREKGERKREKER